MLTPETSAIANSSNPNLRGWRIGRACGSEPRIQLSFRTDSVLGGKCCGGAGVRRSEIRRKSSGQNAIVRGDAAEAHRQTHARLAGAGLFEERLGRGPGPLSKRLFGIGSEAAQFRNMHQEDAMLVAQVTIAAEVVVGIEERTLF